MNLTKCLKDNNSIQKIVSFFKEKYYFIIPLLITLVTLLAFSFYEFVTVNFMYGLSFYPLNISKHIYTYIFPLDLIILIILIYLQWFLLSLIFLFVKKITKKNHKAIFLILLLLITIFISAINVPNNYDLWSNEFIFLKTTILRIISLMI